MEWICFFPQNEEVYMFDHCGCCVCLIGGSRQDCFQRIVSKVSEEIPSCWLQNSKRRQIESQATRQQPGIRHSNWQFPDKPRSPHALQPRSPHTDCGPHAFQFPPRNITPPCADRVPRLSLLVPDSPGPGLLLWKC